MSLNLSSWTRPDKGALFVVSGASGTGKTTLLREALRHVPFLSFSVSATTRPARVGETEGVDYLFLNPVQFQAHVDAGNFLEHAKVYGNHYGTLRTPVQDALAQGMSVVLDIDIQGARQVRESMPDGIGVFLAPTSIEVLEQRLRARGTEAEQTITLRMAQVQEQLNGCGEFKYVVVNDVLSCAHDCLQAVFVAELQKVDRRQSVIQGLTRQDG
ncbi:MAG: guanylate kinase [Cognaticolwellia sp.]